MHKILIVNLLILSIGLRAQTNKENIDWQGHRGARGLMPENTVASFLEALKQGVSTIELDVVMTKDLQVIVSHDPYCSPLFCTKKGIELEDKVDHNIYRMTYKEVLCYDCGTREHPRFENQQHIPAVKPLLSEVFREVEAALQEDYPNKRVRYNIEIKFDKGKEGVWFPQMEVLIEAVMREIKAAQMEDRVYIQSFSVEVLQYLHQKYPEMELSLLVANLKSWKRNLKKLGFTPQYYSPYYKLVKKRKLKKMQEKGLKVIPWTVNELEDMKRLISWGIDGIITDYPNRKQEL